MGIGNRIRRAATAFMLAGVFIVVACASTSSAQAPQQAPRTFTAGTSWVNELGPVLTINSIGAGGLMNGTYTSTVGCGANKPQPMTGYYYAGQSGGAMSFSVAWQNCNSVTSWSGQFNYTTGEIDTLWHLSAAAAPAWNGTYAGADTFTRQ